MPVRSPQASSSGRGRAGRRSRAGWRLYSFRAPAEGLPDPLEVFRRACRGREPAFLWWPAGKGPMVAAGVAAQVEATSPEELARAWPQELQESGRRASLTLVGGWAFDPLRPPGPPWEGFPRLWLAVPRVLARWQGRAAAVTLAARRDAASEEATSRLWQRLSAPASGPSRPPAPPGDPAALAEAEPYLFWQRRVDDALQAIAAGRLRKVVLARAVTLRAPSPLQPEAILARLAASAPPDTVVFALAWEDGCFLGTTPERLLRAEPGRVEVECLAGTAPRGATPEEDARQARALRRSAKDLAEHALVVEAVRAALEPSAVRVLIPPRPGLRRLPHVWHLRTRIRALMPSSGAASVLELLARLHPTPAVGGLPREAALEYLRQNEPFDRGWYAGAIGWLDSSGRGEWVLAIRSGLVRGREATLYAGCGIVAGSDPSREYEETGWKLRTMLEAVQGSLS